MKQCLIYWTRCLLLVVLASLLIFNLMRVYRIGVSIEAITLLKLPEKVILTHLNNKEHHYQQQQQHEMHKNHNKNIFTKKLNQHDQALSQKNVFLINFKKVEKRLYPLRTIKIDESRSKTTSSTTTTTIKTTKTTTTTTTKNSKSKNDNVNDNYSMIEEVNQPFPTDVDTKRDIGTSFETTSTGSTERSTKRTNIRTAIGRRIEPTIGNPIEATIGNNQFIPGAVMDKWIDTCMNMTTWHNRWYPLFPKIPQQSEIVDHLSDDRILYGSLLRRVYGYIHVNKSGLYDFQLKTHEGAEILIVDTGMTLQDFKDPESVDEIESWKELLYINVTLQDMQEQNIFKVYKPRIMLHYKSQVKTIALVRDHVYHIEILQGGRFYAEYLLMWKPHHGLKSNDNFKKISSSNLFHTEATNSRRFPSLLWLKNPPQEKYPYTKVEQNRLDYHKRSVFSINKMLLTEPSSSALKCPATSWYKRNTTRLYSGRMFVDYHLVYPRNHFDYTGGWPLEHLELSKTKAWMIANKTLDRLREMFKG